MAKAQNISYSKDSTNRSINIAGVPDKVDIQVPIVKKRPEFPGGMKAWQDFLHSNININVPITNRALPGTYPVIWFVVDSDGKISRLGAVSICGYGLEAEMIRCIRISSKWIPAETNTGRKVSFILRSLVRFTIKENEVQFQMRYYF